MPLRIPGHARPARQRGAGAGDAPQAPFCLPPHLRIVTELVTHLSTDEIGHVLLQLPLYDRLTRVASVCHAFKLAVSHVSAARAMASGIQLPPLLEGETKLRALSWIEEMAASYVLRHHARGARHWSRRTMACSGRHTLFTSATDGLLESCGDENLVGHRPVAAHFMGHPLRLVQGDIQPRLTSASATHSIVLDADGAVWSWGIALSRDDRDAATGIGRRTGIELPARLALTNLRVLQVAAGHAFSLLLTTTGVLAFGANDDGQLGLGDCDERHEPSAVAGFGDRRLLELTAGYSHAAAVDDAGELWSWGCNLSGKLGQGSRNPRTVLVPTKVAALAAQRMRHASAGRNYTLAVTAAGELYSWGNNVSGQLGLGNKQDQAVPRLVTRLKGTRVRQACAAEYHSVVLTDIRDVYTMGAGDFGRLGHGDFEDRSVPTRVEKLARPVTAEGVKRLSVGELKTALSRRGLDPRSNMGSDGAIKKDLAARLLAAQPDGWVCGVEVAAADRGTFVRAIVHTRVGQRDQVFLFGVCMHPELNYWVPNIDHSVPRPFPFDRVR